MSLARRAAAAVLCLALLCGCGGTGGDGVLRNRDQVTAALRDGLRAHAATITVTFTAREDLTARLPDLAAGWMEDALAETDDPAEGDYLRYQYGGYRVDCRAVPAGRRWRHTVTLTPVYYCLLKEEEAAEARFAAVLADFGFTAETPDYEKLRAVYDYLCRTVRYDLVHSGNPHYHRKSTAYAALVQGTAACQGYAVTLYRLLRSVGVDCRVVTGSASGPRGQEKHAWNLAALDGKWYLLDAAWDAGETEYGWFLRGADSLDSHVPDARFRTAAFQAACPLAPASYGG